MVSISGKKSVKFQPSLTSSVRKSMHSTSDLTVNMTIVDNWSKIAVVDDGFWNKIGI